MGVYLGDAQHPHYGPFTRPYHGLGDGSDYASDLGFSLKLPKIRLPKAITNVAKAIVKPVANIATNFIPGGGFIKTAVQSVIPGIAKAKPANVPKAPSTPVGSPTVQLQRVLSTTQNRPAPTLTAKGPATRALPKSPKFGPGAKAAQSVTPMEQPAQALAVVQKEVAAVKQGATIAAKTVQGVNKLRDKQRQFSDTARRAATTAKTLRERAEKMAAAGVPGADFVAQQAAQVANVAQTAAQGADAAGAAVSAATTAGIAAAATGSEGAGVTAAGITGLIKEHPVGAAVTAAALGYVAMRAMRK